MLLSLREYYRPESLAEAVRLLRDCEGAAVLGGGTELLGRTDDVTRAVIDLQDLNLDSITAAGGTITIGATATLQAIATHPALAESILGRAARQGAPATIRAAATLGGTLAGTKGGWEISTVLLALGATVTLARPDPETIPLAGLLATGLPQGAIITGVAFPIPVTAGFALVSRTPADRAIICAAASDGVAAIGGLAPYPRVVTDRLEEWPAISDQIASADYRRRVAPVLIRRAMEEAGAR